MRATEGWWEGMSPPAHHAGPRCGLEPTGTLGGQGLSLNLHGGGKQQEHFLVSSSDGEWLESGWEGPARHPQHLSDSAQCRSERAVTASEPSQQACRRRRGTASCIPHHGPETREWQRQELAIRKASSLSTE